MKKRKSRLLTASLLFSTFLTTIPTLQVEGTALPERQPCVATVHREMNTELENIFTSEIDPPVSAFITRAVDPENQTAIQIKDRNLERCLKEHFGLGENEPITSKHMKSLIVLDVSNQSQSLPFLTTGENQILLSNLYIDHGCQSTEIKKELATCFCRKFFFI
ncbi:hypothetical protein [Enterococcus lactis]|uniref:hypothetical protein n=1 Tax=Enterococcus lactis TaxID=357441 RepID=UPI003982570A